MATSTLNRDAQLSTLSNAAYLSSPPQQIGDWTLIIPNKPSTSGFFGVAYKNNFTKEVVVSFRGTDGKSDLRADTTFVTGGWSQQFTEAAAFTAQIKTLIANDLSFKDQITGQPYQLLTTGHSLGGGIAQVIGQMFGLSGSTYEAPGALKVADNPLLVTAAALTEGNDTFDIGYYAAYNGVYFNLNLVQNFYAGGGNDTVGGSTQLKISANSEFLEAAA